MICSGDIGPDNKSFHPDPDSPAGIDHVVCEATYGDRRREPLSIDERRRLLKSEVQAAMARGGNLVIPVFALERTQELLLDLQYLMATDEIESASVFVDSPLANRVTGVFGRYASQLEDTGGRNVFDQPQLHYVSEVKESMRLNSVSGAIILAASGMCEGGRIRHHLIHNLHRPDSTVLFVGYQAQGTLGRVILGGAERVRISGRDIKVRAQIRSILSYSAHADQAELLAWIDERCPISGSLFLDHGEAGALEVLRREVHNRHADLSIRLPQIGERYALPPGQPAKRLDTGRVDLAEAVGRDWQNAYADFATVLKSRLKDLQDDRQRREALDNMRAILESYNAHREGERRNRG